MTIVLPAWATISPQPSQKIVSLSYASVFAVLLWLAVNFELALFQYSKFQHIECELVRNEISYYSYLHYSMRYKSPHKLKQYTINCLHYWQHPFLILFL